MRASHAPACLVIVAITLITVFLFACGQSKRTISSTPSIEAPLTTSLLDPVSAKNPTDIITNSSAITTTPDAKAYLPYVVNDSNKNKVTFNQPPQRIVAFDSAAVETLFAIGEGHRIVGTHSFVSYPTEIETIPKVGDAFNINIEAVVALEPDLVFIFFDNRLPDLERVGLKVLYQKSLSEDFRQVADNIRMWGRITGGVNRSEIVAAEFEARVGNIEKSLSSVSEGPSVFQDEGQLWTPGYNTLMGEVFILLKLQNIAHDISGYLQMNPETIVERAPEIIIASYGDGISNNPAFKDVPAVSNNRVYVPDSDALSIASPRYIEGIEKLAAWVYPDLFK